LSKLIGGPSFITQLTLASNGIGIRVKGLADTGADGYIFGDRKAMKIIADKLNLERQDIGRTIPVTAFDGSPGRGIDNTYKVDAWLDGRVERKAPVLEIDLGPANHQVILGRRFFEIHDIKLDVRKRRFIWPDSRRDDKIDRILEIPFGNLLPKLVDAEHQAEVDRREREMQAQIERQKAQKEQR
ncbi:hypothetical protein N658DRAFT_390322, partial [Parathielavia hyrcaniae]